MVLDWDAGGQACTVFSSRGSVAARLGAPSHYLVAGGGFVILGAESVEERERERELGK